MRASSPSVLVILCLLCLGTATATAAAEAGPGDHPDARIGPVLSRVLEGEAAPGDVPGFRLEVGCLTDEGWRSVELYGDGLGFWRGRTQIRLSPERLAELLAAVREAGFPDMPEAFGRSPEGPESPPPPDEPPDASTQEPPEAAGQPARMICHVLLEAAGEAKEVRQFDKGPVSEALKDLAHTVLGAGRVAAEEGVTVESLEDGLRALADGRLDPRALHLQVHRRFEGREDSGLTGWILRLHGREAELQPYTRLGELAPGERHGIDRERFESVVGALRDARPGSLPANLWAAHYTEVRVEILSFERSVLARRFAGMTAGTHGEAQERFTRLFDTLHELVQELQAEG